MELPSAVVLSCGEKSPKDLIHQIMKSDLPDSKLIVDKIRAYLWHVETKYYTCDIHLCMLEEKTLGNLEFADSVQAAVIYFDSKSESSFSKVQEWMVFIDEFNPEVRLLVCENCTDEITDEKREPIQRWCLKNGFELVELNPHVELDNDSEDDFMETTGIQRIIQALQAHLWPNLEMKEQPGLASSKFGQMLQNNNSPDKADAEDSSDTKTLEKAFSELSTTTTANDESSVPSESAACDEYFSGSILSSLEMMNLASNDVEGSQSFEALFQQFQHLKEKAKNLPPEERKAYAEKVVLAFWKAMGGDEDEIAGLDSE